MTIEKTQVYYRIKRVVSVMVVFLLLLGIVACSSNNELQEEPWNETARYENNIRDLERIGDSVDKILELRENGDEIEYGEIKLIQEERELRLSLESVYEDCIDNDLVAREEFEAYKNKARSKYYNDEKLTILKSCIKEEVDESMRDALLEFYELN